MNNNKVVLDFLHKLDKNNNTEWMNDNRSAYKYAKDCWLHEVENILSMLCKYDNENFRYYDAKSCISRITNNRMYNANLPIYKNFFTFSVMEKADMFSPLHISVGIENSFVGCGYHNPDKQTLKNIREAIDYDGQSFDRILKNEEFTNFFNGLSNFTEPLKTTPKGYAKDHPFVEYLRYKSFVISKTLTKKEIISDSFLNLVEQCFVLSEPFRSYLKKANSI